MIPIKDQIVNINHVIDLLRDQAFLVNENDKGIQDMYIHLIGSLIDTKTALKGEGEEVMIINSKDQLKSLAKTLNVRKDWHEPDEQGLEAIVTGSNFDNAGFFGSHCNLPEAQKELCVTLYQNSKPIAEINLATLFSFACDY